MTFTLHDFTEAHGQDFAELARQSPDGGEATITVQFKVNGYTAYHYLRPNLQGVVAISPDHDGIIGIGTMSGYDMMINGRLRKVALLSALMVHPAMRRQGVATALAQWRVDKARDLYGDDVVIYAAIQKGNAGSFKNAQKWSTQLIEGVSCIFPHPSSDQAPEPNELYTIRQAVPNEYQAFADGHNTYYQEFQLHQPITAEKMETIVDHTPFDHRIQSIHVVLDADNQIVAGCQFTNVYELYNVHVKAPFFEGTSTLGSMTKMWYAPTHEAAMTYLWNTILYEYHDRADRVRINVDPRSPMYNVLGFDDQTEQSPNAFVFATDENLDTSAYFNSHF